MNRGLRMGISLLICGILLLAGYCSGVVVGSGPKEGSQDIRVAALIEDPLEEFRTERQQLRQMQISQLNELIYGGNAEQEIVSSAQKQLIDLMNWSEKELTLESVLQLRGFDDVLATVHTDSINIIIRADSLNQQQTAVILELVSRETGVSGRNVKIIPIK